MRTIYDLTIQDLRDTIDYMIDVDVVPAEHVAEFELIKIETETGNIIQRLARIGLAAKVLEWFESIEWESEAEYEDEYDDGQPTMYEEYQDLYGGDDAFDYMDEY